MRASIAVGIDRNFYRNRNRLYGYLYILDVCFSTFVIAPLVVTFWSSTWLSLTFLQFSYRPSFNFVVPIVFGFSVLILFTTVQKHLQVLFNEHVRNRFLYFFSSRLYTELFGIASVSSWYGVWTAVDSVAGANVKITMLIVFTSYVALFCTKTLRNIIASPFAIIVDKRQGYFDVPTLYQWSYNWKKNKFLYILDSIFSVFIVGTLVILVWRGAWCLLDQTIFPGDSKYELSGWTSLAIGYVVVFFTFAIQFVMKVLVRKYHGWKRLLIIDIYIVISFCGTINIWRGIWILLELYANLENSLRNCIILHFSSFLILVIFNSSNTLLVRGVYIDAEGQGEDCIEFPCYYFRLRFQEKQNKQTFVELNKLNNTKLLVDNSDNGKRKEISSIVIKKNVNRIVNGSAEIALETNQQDPLILSTDINNVKIVNKTLNNETN